MCELRQCAQSPVLRKTGAVLIILSFLGSRSVTNPYALGMHGFSTFGRIEWTPFRGLLSNLTAVLTYVIPFVAVIIAFDLFSAPPASAFPRLTTLPRGRLLGRASFLAAIVALAFGVALIGPELVDAADSSELARSLGVLLAAELFGLTIFTLAAAVAALAPTPHRAMLYAMVTLTVLTLGVTLLSDQMLLQEFGPMPLPGTPAWGEYLGRVQQSAGMAVYFLSPTETFLTFVTFLDGVAKVTTSSLIFVWVLLGAQTIVSAGLMAVTFRVRALWGRVRPA